MNTVQCTILLLTLFFEPVSCSLKTASGKPQHTPATCKSVSPGVNLNNSNNGRVSNPEPTNLKQVELSIKSNKGTPQYSYKKADKHVLFTANTGYGFSSVSTKSGGSCCGKEVQIWEADKNDELAIKVIRDGAGTCGSTKNVTIFYPKNKYRHFTLINKKWCLMCDIGLYQSNGQESVSLNASDYKLDYDGNDRFYTFNEATKCCEITYFHRFQDANKPTIALTEDKTVWKLDPKKGDKRHPKSLKFYWQNKILLDFSDMFIVSDKTSDGSWNNNQINIKMYSTDPTNSNLVEMATNNYDLVYYGKDCEFKFEADFKCEVIKYLGNELWKYDPSKHGDRHPLSVFYRDSAVLVNFPNTFLVYQNKGVDGWEELHSDLKMFGNLVIRTGGASASGSPSAANPNNPAVTEVELNLSNYDLEKVGDEYYFNFKENVQCLQIKVLGNELWKHDASKYGDKYPTFLRYEKNTELLINLEDLIIFYQRNKDLAFDQATELNVKLYGPKVRDSADSTNPKAKAANGNASGAVEELRKYEFYDEIEDFEFKMGQNEKCTLIKVGEQDLWQHDSAKDGDNYPDLIAYKKDGSRLLVYFNNYFVLCTKADDGQWSSKRSINLDISKQESTESYTYSEHSYYDTFSGNTDVFFKKVTLGESVIYESEDMNHSVSRVVIYKAHGNVVDDVTVFMLNGTIERFNKIDDSDRWYQRLTPLSLDIKRKEPSYYYECYRRRGLVTFVSKNNFGFRRVRYGMKLVWESKHDTAYGSKVEVDEHNGSSDVKIYLYNGETRVFKIKNIPYIDSTPLSLDTASTSEGEGSEEGLEDQLGSEDSKPALKPSPIKDSELQATPASESEDQSGTPDPKAFDLDIEMRETTDEYSCTHEDAKRLNRFECKGDHKIKSVKKGDHVLWERKGAKYAVQVDIYYMNETNAKTNEDAKEAPQDSSSGTSGSGDGSGSSGSTDSEDAANTQGTQNDRKLAIVVYLDKAAETKQMYLKQNPNDVGYEKSKPVTVVTPPADSTHTGGSEEKDGGQSTDGSSGSAGTGDSSKSSSGGSSGPSGTSQQSSGGSSDQDSSGQPSGGG